MSLLLGGLGGYEIGQADKANPKQEKEEDVARRMLFAFINEGVKGQVDKSPSDVQKDQVKPAS